jgi:DNA-binding winged helix-turn-helix (wHTH) protein
VRLRFADCVLDTATRELRRGGSPVSLPPKAFALLLLLVERRPEAVSQDDIHKELWGDMAGGTTIARLVNEVRAAVADTAGDPRIIRTVPRFGYAFCADAQDESPAVVCALQWGTRQMPLTPGKYVIGRGAEASVPVPVGNVSRRHAQITVTRSGATLEDLGSRNGTYVGDAKISGPVTLKHDDRIVIGPATFVFCQADDEATTQ